MISNTIYKKFYNYIFLHVILLLYALGSIFSKLASMQEFGTLKFLGYYSVVIGILIIYAVLWQQILKRFSVSTAFANKSIVVVWGMIFGNFIFGEQITINMIIGSFIIFIGIYLVVSEDG